MIDQSRYKPRIFRQGLILILVPFAVVSAVLLLLVQLCVNQEKISEMEQNQSQTLGNCMTTFNDWGEASASLMGRAFTPDLSYSESSQKIIQRLKGEFALIRSIPTSTSMPLSAEKIENLCMGSIDELMSLPRASSSDAMANYVTLQKMPGIIRKLYVLPGKVRALLESEWTSLKAERKKQDKQAQQLKRVAIGFLIANILLSIILVWIFARGIRSRLQLVTDNASRVPRLEKLDAKVSGNDELAYLGAVLDEASEKLIAASEHRRAIFGMVAHDMRSPITAGQLSLDLLQEGLEKNTGSPDPEITIAQDKLTGILKHVNEILAVEKTKEGTESESLRTGGSPAHVPDQSPALATRRTPSTFLSSMFFSPGIFHKVLWLVLIPLLLQSAFVCFLLQQLQVNENLIQEERRKCDITMNVNLMFLDSLKATVSELIFLINNDSKIKDLVVNNFKTVDRETSELVVQLADTDDERLGTIKSWRKLLRTYASELSAFSDENRSKRPAEMMDSLRSFRPMQKKALKVRARAKKIFDADTLQTQKLREEQQESRQNITQILCVGLFANFVVSMLMFFAFSKDVSSRLKRVVQNAAALSNPEKTMPAPLPGKDELSYLDLILQHTKAQLEIASRQRADMMNLIAEQMQAPLKQAQKALLNFRSNQASGLNDRMSRQLNRTQGNIDRVLLLVNDLLTMETLEIGRVGLEKSNCRLQELVDESLATVASLAAEKKIELLNESADLEIIADRSRIIQTLINYLSNAIKFSGEKTKIRVASSICDEQLRVSVIDEGPGMDEATRSRVFERFFQAESAEKKQGFGLGLAICSLIISSHEGSVGVDSEPGNGSSFWFELPMQASEVPQPTNDPTK